MISKLIFHIFVFDNLRFTNYLLSLELNLLHIISRNPSTYIMWDVFYCKMVSHVKEIINIYNKRLNSLCYVLLDIHINWRIFNNVCNITDLQKYTRNQLPNWHHICVTYWVRNNSRYCNLNKINFKIITTPILKKNLIEICSEQKFEVDRI